MGDSTIKEPSVIHVITQPFTTLRNLLLYNIYDLWFRPVSYVLLSPYCIQQTIKRNESLECNNIDINS